MKNFELVQNVLSVLVMALFGVIIGLAMVPSYLLFIELTSMTEGKGGLVEAVGICVGLGLGYIIWGSRATNCMRIDGRSFQDQERRGEVFFEVFHYNSMGILIGVSQGRSDFSRPRSTVLPCKFVLQDDGC